MFTLLGKSEEVKTIPQILAEIERIKDGYENDDLKIALNDLTEFILYDECIHRWFYLNRADNVTECRCVRCGEVK